MELRPTTRVPLSRSCSGIRQASSGTMQSARRTITPDGSGRMLVVSVAILMTLRMITRPANHPLLVEVTSSRVARFPMVRPNDASQASRYAPKGFSCPTGGDDYKSCDEEDIEHVESLHSA